MSGDPPLYRTDRYSMHVYHRHRCGKITEFSYSPPMVTACSWTCDCGETVQLPRTTRDNVVFEQPLDDPAPL